MTPEEQTTRVEAAAAAVRTVEAELLEKPINELAGYVFARAALDAADHAVPVVSKAQLMRAVVNVMQLDMLRRSEEERAALKQEVREWQVAYDELSAKAGTAIAAAHLQRGATERALQAAYDARARLPGYGIEDESAP